MRPTTRSSCTVPGENLPLTSLSHGNPTERIFNFSYHDFLVVWSRVIEATRLGDIIQPLVPYMARHSGPSIDAALATRTRKEIKDQGRWKSDCSVLRYEQRARLHKSFHRLPAAYQVYVLKCENVLHKVISGSTPINSVQMTPVRGISFCPGATRGAYIVVLSSGACEVGRRIRQRGFLVGRYRISA